MVSTMYVVYMVYYVYAFFIVYRSLPPCGVEGVVCGSVNSVYTLYSVHRSLPLSCRGTGGPTSPPYH